MHVVSALHSAPVVNFLLKRLPVLRSGTEGSARWPVGYSKHHAKRKRDLVEPELLR